MDHLPLPLRPFRPPLKFTIYSKEDYNLVPFFKYLKHIGWDIEDIASAEKSRKSKGEIHAVLQTWTYFGLINTATRRAWPTNTFMRTGPSGEEFLTSEPLTQILQDWIDGEHAKTYPQQVEYVEHMSEILRLIASVYNTMHLRSPTFLDPALILSVELCIEYIVRAIVIATTPAERSGPEIPAVKHEAILRSEDLLCQQMRKLNWCESEIHMLVEFCSKSEMAFASLLNPPGPNKNHSLCTREKCVAYQITDSKSYVTLHADSACNCEFVFASQDRLGEILLRGTGSIPLVGTKSPRRDTDGKLYVDLLDSRSSSVNGTNYVAISHVWSDGLGNNKSNSIPFCQFKRLSNLVCSLYAKDDNINTNNNTTALWLDTLCFPLNPPAAYDEALIRMRQSYEEADRVLVLDKYLLAQPCADMAPEEVAIRVMCMPWNKRLWTLQEGVLARSLAFQFSDTFVDLSDFATRRSNPYATLPTLVFGSSWRYFESLRVLETETDKTMNVMQANRALTFRSTSEADDEPLCLGNLLGVDPGSVVRAGTRNERMKVIWQNVSRHFSSTIFWSAPKLTADGFTWAPATFMEAGCARAKTCSEKAVMKGHSGGLFVTLPGILGTTTALRRPQTFRMVVDDHKRFVVQWSELWDCPFDSQTHTTRLVDISVNGQFIILLTAPIDPESLGVSAQLCIVEKVTGKTYELKVLGRVRVYRLEVLKHHPDYRLPQADQLPDPLPPRPLPPAIKPMPTWKSQEERVETIWKQVTSATAKGVMLDMAKFRVK